MKLELPNGVSLFLWENEVDKIYLKDSCIEVVRPSGRTLQISLSETWLKSIPKCTASGSSSILQIPPSLPSKERSQPFALAMGSNAEIVPETLAPNFTIHKMLEDLNMMIEKTVVVSSENHQAIESLREEADGRYTELKERLEHLDNERIVNMTQIEGKTKEISQNHQSLMEELKEICTFLTQKDQSEPQDDFKKKKKK